METVSQVGSKTRTALTYLLDELIRLKEDNEFSSRYVTRYDTSKCFPGGSDGKESACNPGDPGSIPRLGIFPWRKESLPTPVFLPGEFHE